jgi:hypothetical protein
MRGIVLDWFVSKNMAMPTADSPDASQEEWEPAKYLIRARVYAHLGHRPSYVEATFAITGVGAVFPWQRVKAVDRMTGTPIGIWRAESVVRESDPELGLVWRLRGVDCLYGVEDNYIRSPFINSLPEDYTEWPTVDVAREEDFTNEGFPSAREKVGPNYVGAKARRGWIFKDLTRFSSGSYDSPSRPIVAVYNRSDPVWDGNELNANWSLASGIPANRLMADVAKAWPWPPGEKGIGWDYRSTWIGKEEPFSPSGQAVEIFPRGSQKPDLPCFGNPGPPRTGNKPCGEIKYLVAYFQGVPTLKAMILNDPPSPDLLWALRPLPSHDKYIEATDLVAFVVAVCDPDEKLGNIDLSSLWSFSRTVGNSTTPTSIFGVVRRGAPVIKHPVLTHYYRVGGRTFAKYLYILYSDWCGSPFLGGTTSSQGCLTVGHGSAGFAWIIPSLGEATFCCKWRRR